MTGNVKRVAFTFNRISWKGSTCLVNGVFSSKLWEVVITSFLYLTLSSPFTCLNKLRQGIHNAQAIIMDHGSLRLPFVLGPLH